MGVGLESFITICDLLGNININPLVEGEDFTIQTMVLPCQDTVTGIRVDVIFSHSPYERQALERVRTVTMEGIDVASQVLRM